MGTRILRVGITREGRGVGYCIYKAVFFWAMYFYFLGDVFWILKN